YAVAVVHRGLLVAERYGGALEHWHRPPEAVEPATGLVSWSIAKSMLHAVVGMLVADGQLDLDDPAPVPAWSTGDAPRRDITVDHLLTIRGGLVFQEAYDAGGTSDVIEMLFGAGQADIAAYAASRPAAHPPGTVFNYSSGSSAVISGLVAGLVGPGPAYERFLRDRLFGPLGM